MIFQIVGLVEEKRDITFLSRLVFFCLGDDKTSKKSHRLTLKRELSHL